MIYTLEVVLFKGITKYLPEYEYFQHCSRFKGCLRGMEFFKYHIFFKKIRFFPRNKMYFIL